MKQTQLQAERLIFIAIMKNLSEHSTYLTGELKMKLKQDFNGLVRLTDNLIKDFEGKLTDNEKDFIQGITDVYHNINIEIRNGAVSKYEQLDK